MSKLDYYVAGFIGFLVGVFAIPTVFSLGVATKPVLLALPIVMPFLFALGAWLGGIIGKKIAFVNQFSRFVAVGFLNTAIDFGILNMVSSLTGVTTGIVVGGINIPGFAAAVINSYFWNKLWVFKDKDKGGLLKDVPSFVVVTAVGLVLNSLIVIMITTYIPPVLVKNPKAWLNLAKIAATAFSFIWNFLGYKLIVFSKK